jgi:hypothetical protein
MTNLSYTLGSFLAAVNVVHGAGTMCRVLLHLDETGIFDRAVMGEAMLAARHIDMARGVVPETV